MVRKKERLSTKEFSRFFSLGKRLHSPSLTLVYTKAIGLSVAVVVSKKVARSAVMRNHLRRRLYSLIQTFQPTGGVYIVIAKPQSATHTFLELASEVQQLLGSAAKAR
ncbi:ribonuclease P protein component [Candidatus Kaiserbacteria bacterium]|nr:ribonuclease P protein component [Candidatus Kaiserbacteria bacterium]